MTMGEETEKANELRKLVDEIEDLAYWAHDYAEIMNDAEREKMSNASVYLHVLKALIKICSDETLVKLPLF